MAHQFNKDIAYIENSDNPNSLGLSPVSNAGKCMTLDGTREWNYNDSLAPGSKWVEKISGSATFTPTLVFRNNVQSYSVSSSLQPFLNTTTIQQWGNTLFSGLNTPMRVTNTSSADLRLQIVGRLSYSTNALCTIGFEFLDTSNNIIGSTAYQYSHTVNQLQTVMLNEFVTLPAGDLVKIRMILFTGSGTVTVSVTSGMFVVTQLNQL